MFLFGDGEVPKNENAAAHCKAAIEVLEYDFPDETATVGEYFKNLIGCNSDGKEDDGKENEGKENNSGFACGKVNDLSNGSLGGDGEEDACQENMGGDAVKKDAGDDAVQKDAGDDTAQNDDDNAQKMTSRKGMELETKPDKNM